MARAAAVPIATAGEKRRKTRQASSTPATLQRKAGNRSQASESATPRRKVKSQWYSGGWVTSIEEGWMRLARRPEPASPLGTMGTEPGP